VRYTLDIEMEIDGHKIVQHVTNLTEGGVRVHLAELRMAPGEIVKCVISESEPFDPTITSA
jgi:hypothetical protein